MPRFIGTKLLLLTACFLSALTAPSGSNHVARAQDATPQAPPPGTDLGLGALVYQADFSDAKAWPDASALSAKLSANAGVYSASSTTTAMVFSPSTAYRGRDYYAEMSIALKDCQGDGTLYFVTHSTQNTVQDGDSFAYIIACDGSIVARRISGGDLRLSSGTAALGDSFAPGQHTLGIYMVGMRARFYVDGQPAGSISSATMPQIGRVAFGVSGNISLTVDQLHIWSLAADNVPSEAGTLLYDADFQDDLQWLDGAATESLSRVADETYLITTIGKPFVPLSGKVQQSEIVVVEDISMRHCGADGSVGVVVRASAGLSGAYAFVLQCDGTYKAGLLNSQTRTIDKPDVTGSIGSDEVFTSDHRLSVVATGRGITLTIDGNQVGQGTDDRVVGDVGLYAAPSSDGQQTVASVTTLTVWATK